MDLIKKAKAFFDRIDEDDAQWLGLLALTALFAAVLLGIYFL